jgi:CHAT domain-containing protein
MLVELGDSDRAFAAAEAHKARILRDVAGRTRATAPRPAAEEAAERVIVEKVESMNRAVYTEKDPARIASLRMDLARTRLELDDLRARFAANVPGNELYASASRAPRVRWPYRDVTALHYMVGKERTLIFVVRAGSAGRPQIDVKTVDITRDELERLAGELRDRIMTRDLRYATPARRLYDVLIAPVEKMVGRAKTLCIIPDGELWKVPFHALIARDGGALLERAAVFYAPSIAMLETVHEPRAAPVKARLLALGNPTVGDGTVARFRALDRSIPLGNLAEAETEVRDIARLYGRDRSRVYLRGEAREAVFKETAHEFDVVHVAAHGVLDNAQPRYSALVLAASNGESDDGLLEAHEVAELRLNADLVVLSACETAAGKVGGGEGILGLSWAFLAAGADGLVGSQWKAPSAATEQLMVAFHERLVAGDTPAEALRHAQRRLMRDERYASPLDWAPFIIVGDGL